MHSYLVTLAAKGQSPEILFTEARETLGKLNLKVEKLEYHCHVNWNCHVHCLVAGPGYSAFDITRVWQTREPEGTVTIRQLKNRNAGLRFFRERW